MPYKDRRWKSINTLERAKFDVNDSDEVIVRTTAEGTFSPSGLNTAGDITVLSVGTSAVKLPSTPLTNRNSISVYNKSLTATLYIGFDNSVTADDTSTGGWEIPPQNYFNTDITENVELWGISTTTITVKVLELA